MARIGLSGAAAALLWLAACGNPEAKKDKSAPAAQTAEAPPAETAEAVAPRPWFLCDSIDQPVVIVASAADGARTTQVQIHSKTGAAMQSLSFRLSSQEGAAGSTFQNWTRAGTDGGYVRTINPGVLASPDDAYTPPITSVRMGEQDYSCRWLARTRFAGFTARRSIVISQDGDGDLVYQSFDFANAASAQRVDLDGAQRSTVFSVEARDGTEADANGVLTFTFARGGFSYVVTAPRNGAGSLRVLRGEREVSNDPLIAFVTGPD